MFLQTKLYASYVRYWHFAQYVAHLVDITCMWVEADVGKGDAGGCQASAHRPRLRFDIWKTLQDFSPAVFVVTKPGHVGRKPLFCPNLTTTYMNVNVSTYPLFAGRFSANIYSGDWVADAPKHRGRCLVVKTRLWFLWFYTIVKMTSSHSTGTEMSVMGSKQPWHKHLLTKHTNAHNGKHITHRQRPLRPPATRRRNRTDKRAINHFTGFKKNTRAQKKNKKKHTSTASLYHIYSERGRRFVTSGTG